MITRLGRSDTYRHRYSFKSLTGQRIILSSWKNKDELMFYELPSLYGVHGGERFNIVYQRFSVLL